MTAIPRWVIWTRPLWARTLKGVGKKGKVLSAVHIDDAKSGQMWSAPLHVKETRAKFADQPHQRRLGGITAILRVVKHRLTTEKSPNTNAVEASYQTALRVPRLN